MGWVEFGARLWQAALPASASLWRGLILLIQRDVGTDATRAVRAPHRQHLPLTIAGNKFNSKNRRAFLDACRYHEVDKPAEKEMTMKPRPFRFGVLCEQMDMQRAWVDKARQIEESGYATLLIRDQGSVEPHYLVEHKTPLRRRRRGRMLPSCSTERRCGRFGGTQGRGGMR
jgi:hypothetical protein